MQKGSATLFLLVVGLVVVALIGIFYSGLIKPSASSTPALSQKTPTVVSKILTYSNPSLSFELQYSKDLSVKEDSEDQFNKRGNGDFRKNFKGYVGYEPGKVLGAIAVLDQSGSYDNNPLSVWVFDNPDGLTIDRWFENYWYYPFLWGVFDYTSKSHISLDKEATVSGQPAKYKIVSYQPGSPKFMYVSKGDKMYLFRIIGEIGDKILSSFKFLQ
ncbi:MAG: hypothetical protein Q7R82_01580 [Candidatus Daviesbacteria bacterium]|nr:hypothetical protein [Candidatus Daviesbacteria bacterium]